MEICWYGTGIGTFIGTVSTGLISLFLQKTFPHVWKFAGTGSCIGTDKKPVLVKRNSIIEGTFVVRI